MAYLKNPPPGYQQPAVDVLAGLQQILDDIDQGKFANQYAFEAAVQNLIYAAHDAHFQMDAGVLAAFTFSSPYALVSLSSDGLQLPKVYTALDILYQIASNGSYTASAIKMINGEDVTAYLTKFAAANSPGNVEPNADWNDLFSSFASYIQDDYSILEAYGEFYPGETITLSFENGTTLDPEPWLASYNSPGPTGPLSTGGDFYNFFALGLYPASFDPNVPDPCTSADSTSSNTTPSSASATASTPSATATSWPNSSYPDTADIFQPGLYPDGGGFVTGYFLKDLSTAVLSIPTFEMYGDDIQTFSDTVQKFLTEAHQAGLQKILIDLQQNLGGDTLLAVDTFKHFFPTKDGFRGGRLRAHEQADVLGNTFTTLFETNTTLNSTIRNALSVSEWVATARIDTETSQNFTSWGQFFGPHEFNGDTFTTVERENISNPIYDENALGIDIYAAAAPATSPQLYNPEDITLLTDDLCASACALFVELMHFEQGVKSVVVGGLPQNGPIQIAGGTRGPVLYLAEDIDNDIAIAEAVNASTADFLPNRDEDFFITYLGVNLRDQIRKGQNVPLQFVYDAADCRIFYTADTWFDYSKLWTTAINALSNPSKLCVAGSTGYAVTSTSSTSAASPPAPQVSAYNASAKVGTNNEFAGGLTRPQMGEFIKTFQGKPFTNVQACNNHGRICPGGRNCIFKESEGVHTLNGRTFEFKRGVCPSSTQKTGFNSLTSRLSEPAEIRGNGGRIKAGIVSDNVFKRTNSRIMRPNLRRQ